VHRDSEARPLLARHRQSNGSGDGSESENTPRAMAGVRGCDVGLGDVKVMSPVETLPQNNPLVKCVLAAFGGRVYATAAGDGGCTRLSGAPPPPPAAAPGLVYRRIFGRRERGVNVEVYVRDVIVKRENSVKLPASGGGKRGKVESFSRASSRRLKWYVRNLPELQTVGRTSFACLTYPAEFPTDGRVVKGDLHRLRRELVRRGVGGVWALEFQKRGAPHLHLLLSEFVDKTWLSETWFRIVGSGDAKHLRAGTRIEAMRVAHGVVAYIAGYVSKHDQKSVPEAYEGVGRFWGHFGVKLVPRKVITGNVGSTAGIVRRARQGAKSVFRGMEKEKLVRECEAQTRSTQEMLAETCGGTSQSYSPVTALLPEHLSKYERRRVLGRRRRARRDDGSFSTRIYEGGRFV